MKNEPQLEIRFTNDSDREALFSWFHQEGMLRWYPMSTDWELEDAIKQIWQNIPHGVVITATLDEEPVGIANLYLQSFQKISHQSLFAIIVKKDCQGKGIGTALLTELIEIAKRKEIELLHLEVYEGNPAIRLYERLGFERFGEEKNFIKEDGKYFSKILMQKWLGPTK